MCTFRPKYFLRYFFIAAPTSAVAASAAAEASLRLFACPNPNPSPNEYCMHPVGMYRIQPTVRWFGIGVRWTQTNDAKSRWINLIDLPFDSNLLPSNLLHKNILPAVDFGRIPVSCSRTSKYTTHTHVCAPLCTHCRYVLYLPNTCGMHGLVVVLCITAHMCAQRTKPFRFDGLQSSAESMWKILEKFMTVPEIPLYGVSHSVTTCNYRVTSPTDDGWTIMEIFQKFL